jgi:protein transport protein SEC31
MQRVTVKVPSDFAPQAKDMQKRMNLLFEYLNNEELVKPDTIQRLTEMAEAIQSKNYADAEKMRLAIQTEKTDECGNWMVC